MGQVAFRMDDDLIDRIDDELEYGDTRTDWFHEAALIHLELLNEVDEFDKLSTKGKVEFIHEEFGE